MNPEPIAFCLDPWERGLPSQERIHDVIIEKFCMSSTFLIYYMSIYYIRIYHYDKFAAHFEFEFIRDNDNFPAPNP
jgi:hypothetical protein